MLFGEIREKELQIISICRLEGVKALSSHYRMGKN
jgi:hypothetical protein